jgi:MoxR-like ATPase
MQLALEDVEVDPSIVSYVVGIVTATRAMPSVEVGASPRGSLAVLVTARARAALAGRDFVTPEDVKAVAVPALAHRLVLRPELWVRGVRPEQAVAGCLDSVPVPVTAP